MTFLAELLLPDALTAPFRLSFSHLDAITPLHTISVQGIDERDRIKLEALRNIDQIRWYPSGLSKSGKSTALKALNTLVQEEILNISQFPMTSLRGLSASKSNLGSYSSLSEFGQHSLGMRDIANKTDEEIIEICKEWGESSFHEQQSIVIDDWYNRSYWQNSGGSHHTAVLVHILIKKGLEFYIKAKVTRYELDVSKIDALNNELSFYVVKGLLPCTIRSTGQHRHHGVLEYLGLAFYSFDLNVSAQLDGYHIVAVEKVALWSGTTKRKFESLRKEKKALTLQEFLKPRY